MASKEDIITLPNPHLRQRSRRVGIITPEIHGIIKDMEQAALDWESSREHEVGVALAAIQIDKPLKIIIVRADFENKDNKEFVVLINPEITKLEGGMENDFEGCLSVADIYGSIPRYKQVRVRALDEAGHEIRIKAEGMLARVLQHEIDHLNGKVFVDHIEDQHDAFYELTADGKLEPMPYGEVINAGIFK